MRGKKTWFCEVQVEFLRPVEVNGVLTSGFGVPLEVLEEKYLVKYLANFTEKVHLSSLNGEWVSAGGENLTKWWNSVKEVKASEIQDYINEIWDRMTSNNHYDYVFPTGNWKTPPKPQPNQTVKIYSIKLWYGARLDILAYQNPTDPTKLEVILYGTIDNMTAWYHGIARLAMSNGIVRTYVKGSSAEASYSSSTPVVVGFANSLAKSLLDFTEQNNPHFKHGSVKLAVWRIHPEAGGGTLVTANYTLKPDVYWVLEESAFEPTYPAPASEMYWLIIGAPTFQLTANIVLPRNIDYLGYVEWVKDVIHSMLTPSDYDYTLMNYPNTPLALKVHKGVCEDFSQASALVASLASGLPVEKIDGGYLNNPLGHAISVIVVPSSIVKNPTDIPAHVDIDGDEVGDSGMILYDTAEISGEVLDYFLHHIDFIVMAPPYHFAVTDSDAGPTEGDYIELAGLANYINMIGEPFHFKTQVNIANGIIALSNNDNKFIREPPPMEPENINSPDAKIYSRPAYYIWKIVNGTISGALIYIPENVTPEWFFQQYLLPKYDPDSGWWGIPDDSLQAVGYDKYFTPSIDFVENVYLTAIEYVWGLPKNIDTPAPPVPLAKMLQPPKLSELYPQLIG